MDHALPAISTGARSASAPTAAVALRRHFFECHFEQY
jgi:hypothetical protein